MEHINENLIQRIIRRVLYNNHTLICPNLAPPGWWECDVFSITNTRFFIEHEIKLTKADFRADAKKSREIGEWVHHQWVGETVYKHDLLAEGNEWAPARFWYVTPEGLLDDSDIPKWAGLKEFRANRHNWYDLVVRKKAPLIHKGKVKTEVREKIATTFYYRFHNKCREVEALQAELDRIKGPHPIFKKEKTI